jgi:hypothetical protein
MAMEWVIVEISPNQKFVPIFSSAAKIKTIKKITTSK